MSEGAAAVAMFIAIVGLVISLTGPTSMQQIRLIGGGQEGTNTGLLCTRSVGWVYF